MGASLGVFHGVEGGDPCDPLRLGGERRGEDAEGEGDEEPGAPEPHGVSSEVAGIRVCGLTGV